MTQKTNAAEVRIIATLMQIARTQKFRLRVNVGQDGREMEHRAQVKENQRKV